ncbi:hypothetical protein MA16_Dca001488 [Dendrobium catenatum]|uniref:Uncharacterized protein n=1 Tax=Dendrobium catenatum TaxID=906689 RepID=A0A2I0WMJ1_9ASPA|nr:hypothetical protein MA16_Dca001488 [Dendrobium catenatum]
MEEKLSFCYAQVLLKFEIFSKLLHGLLLAAVLKWRISGLRLGHEELLEAFVRLELEMKQHPFCFDLVMGQELRPAENTRLPSDFSADHFAPITNGTCNGACCDGKPTADLPAPTTPERFRRYWSRSMRRNKPISHYFRRTLRQKITGAITGGYCARLFKLNETKSVNVAPKKSPTSDPLENPSPKGLFSETEPLWPVTSFLPFSHLARGPKKEEKRRREGRSSSSTTAGTSTDHLRSLDGPPPEPRRTTAGASPDHHMRPSPSSDHRRSLVGPPPEALTFTRGPHLRQRPSPTFEPSPSSKTLTFARGPHQHLRPSPSPKALTFASGPHLRQRPSSFPEALTFVRGPHLRRTTAEGPHLCVTIA